MPTEDYKLVMYSRSQVPGQPERIGTWRTQPSVTLPGVITARRPEISNVEAGSEFFANLSSKRLQTKSDLDSITDSVVESPVSPNLEDQEMISESGSVPISRL